MSCRSGLQTSWPWPFMSPIGTISAGRILSLLKVATDRQAQYGRRFGDGSYTPEIVVDGSSGVVGSDRGDVDHAVAKARANSATVADVRVVAKDGKASIDVGAGQGAARVVLVGLRSRTCDVDRPRRKPRPHHGRGKYRSLVSIRCESGAERRSISTNSFRKANRSRLSSRLRMGASSARPGRSGPDRLERGEKSGQGQPVLGYTSLGLHQPWAILVLGY